MSELKDVFTRIKEMSAVPFDAAKRIVDREIKKSNAAAKRQSDIAELKDCAEESQALMADKRYPRHQKWLAELRAGYSRALEATDPKLTTEMAKIQGKIANLDTLMNHAAAAVKEYEALRKSEEGK